MNDSAQLFQRLREALPLARASWTCSGRQAGVLVALTDEQRPRVLLGRRALHLPLHPGEIAFPGGKREAGDTGPWDTALREAFEEVACPPGGSSASPTRRAGTCSTCLSQTAGASPRCRIFACRVIRYGALRRERCCCW